MEDFEIQAAFDEFFNAKMSTELASVAADFPQRQSLEINFKALERYNCALADELLEHPDVCLRLAAKAIQAMKLPSPSEEKFSPKVRVVDIPENYTVAIQDIDAKYANKLIQIEGTVKAIGDKEIILKTDLSMGSRYINVQKITLMGKPTKTEGKIENLKKEVYLEDDLVGTVSKGDFLLLTCILRIVPLQKKPKPAIRQTYDYDLDVIFVAKNN